MARVLLSGNIGQRPEETATAFRRAVCFLAVVHMQVDSGLEFRF